MKSVTRVFQQWVLAGLFFIPFIATADEIKRPDPKRFLKEIEKFDLQEKNDKPARGGIVFTGSSSIRLWDLKKAFPELPVLNRGFGGSVAHDLVVYADRVAVRYQPKILVVYTGSNDLHLKLTPEQVKADYTRFLKYVHKKSPHTVVMINPVKIARSRIKEIPDVERTNALMKDWCADRDWIIWLETDDYLIDAQGQPRDELYREDKLHLNEKGYAKWNAIIRPVLHEEWSKPSKKPWFRPKNLAAKALY